MSNFQKERFDELIKNFYKIKRRVLQSRPISSKQEKIKEYIKLLIETYNNILIYTLSYDEQLPSILKIKIHDKILNCRDLLVRCFCKLNCKIKVPYGENLFELVQEQIMTDLGESQDYTDKSEESTDTEENTTELIKSFSDFKDIPKMTSIEEKTKFISMCSNIIRENFDGNPLSLNSFIDKINLIEELTVPDLSNCLISFIKSKLDGKAREILPENITSIDQIKNTLKNRIRPDNSKVVAGRIAALQVKNNNYTDFSKNIEDLADALQRSLVIEGITTEKAQEMVIEQTVSICRNNAKSDMVKAILASTVFKEPKDVVAKLIIEESTNQKEYQVLAIGHRNTKSFIRSNQNNTYNKNNGYRGQNNSYGRNKAYRGQNNSHYNRNNSYYNQNNNNNLNKYNNFRGRNFNNRGKYHNNSGNQGAFVRTLNAQAPQHEVLREEEGQM
ncbi:hypothetical protein CVS40_1314 [Lucilia cuprina]|nr:hypothetical protein CVS40_1314 [Lucilia cuprina]